ncbi:hypothetical protein ACOMHN_057837 [Nucella lapillus]
MEPLRASNPNPTTPTTNPTTTTTTTSQRPDTTTTTLTLQPATPPHSRRLLSRTDGLGLTGPIKDPLRREEGRRLRIEKIRWWLDHAISVVTGVCLVLVIVLSNLPVTWMTYTHTGGAGKEVPYWQGPWRTCLVQPGEGLHCRKFLPTWGILGIAGGIEFYIYSSAVRKRPGVLQVALDWGYSVSLLCHVLILLAAAAQLTEHLLYSPILRARCPCCTCRRCRRHDGNDDDRDDALGLRYLPASGRFVTPPSSGRASASGGDHHPLSASGAGGDQPSASGDVHDPTSTSGVGGDQLSTSGAGHDPTSTFGVGHDPTSTSGVGGDQLSTSGAGHDQPSTSGGSHDPTSTSGGSHNPISTFGAGRDQPSTTGAGGDQPLTSGAGHDQPSTSVAGGDHLTTFGASVSGAGHVLPWTSGASTSRASHDQPSICGAGRHQQSTPEASVSGAGGEMGQLSLRGSATTRGDHPLSLLADQRPSTSGDHQIFVTVQHHPTPRGTEGH